MLITTGLKAPPFHLLIAGSGSGFPHIRGPPQMRPLSAESSFFASSAARVDLAVTALPGLAQLRQTGR